jgi:hypothetical protein
LLSDKQLKLVGVDNEVLREAVEYCDVERLGILSILNPSAAMIY